MTDLMNSDAETPAETPRRSRASRPARGDLAGWFRDLPRGARWGIGVPVALVAALLVAVAADAAVSWGRVHPGVWVSGIAVGTLSRTAAERRLASELGARLAKPVTARYEKSQWEVPGARLGVAVDARASVERALAVGNEGSLWRRIAVRVRALFAGVDITAKVDADPSKVTGLFDEIDDSVAQPARDAQVTLEGATPRLVPASLGVRLSRAAASKALLAAFASNVREVTLPIDRIPARVSDADAQQALTDAKAMLSGSAVVQWEKQSWTFEPAAIAGWLSFRSVPLGSSAASAPVPAAGSGEATTAAGADASGERMMLAAYVDPAGLSDTIRPLAGNIGRPAVDAKFVVIGGRVTVSGGQVGLGPDIDTLASDLTRELVAGGSRRATLRLSTLEPALTAEKAKTMGIVERISTYTTTYSASAKQRVNNIHTLADALNDKLVAPGGTFDFNAAVGERTAAKGYQEAPAIVNGKLVPQLGGGICQIGTTFFNSVFFSGLPVVERRNHSFYISHYPKGRDCTISWGGPNLRWKNDTSTWILIKTSYTNSSVTISLYGTDPGYDVSYTTSDFVNVRPHTVVEVKDPTLLVGVRVVEDSGVDGATVTVVRTVTKGGVVVRTDTFVSNYKPKEETVRVGTRVKSTTPTSTPTP